MKYLKSYKIYESGISKPIDKYPVNYKCVSVDAIIEKIYKLGLDLTEIPCKGSKYGTMDFFRWCGDNLSPIYPNHTLSEEDYKSQKKQFAGTGIPYNKISYFEKDSVYEIPISYDSSGDLDKWELRRDKFREDMSKMAEMSGREYNIDNEKYVDFGPKSNEWVNIALSKIHELYSGYYKDGKLKIWNDGSLSIEGSYDYPMGKSYFLSELEDWLFDTFDVDTSGFYEWILKCQYVEGRYWEMTWVYDLEDKNYDDEDAPSNVRQINEILRQLYKVDSMDIYIDYYKEVDNSVFK